MKILFLCHRFPLPVEGGAKIRALQIIRHLVARGHDVTVCSLVRSPAEEGGVEELQAQGIRCVVAPVNEFAQTARMLVRLVTLQPSSFGYFYSPRLAGKIDVLQRAETWDLILTYCSSMGPYVSDIKGVCKLIDFVDMDSQKWLDYARFKHFPLNIGYYLEGLKLERAERRLARRFDCCTTISGNEHGTLVRLGQGINADWFPNGVDLEYFSVGDCGSDLNLIVFVGRMDYFPNQQGVQWFCDAVWPRLRALRAELRLRIVGASPSRAIRALSSREGVEVTGSVPDVRPLVREAALTVVPLRIARGMQNKVLESMAMGVPVIATPLVALGLGLDQESPLRVADTAEEYVTEILDITGSPKLRADLAAASRLLVEKEFSWEKTLQRFDAIVESCLRAGLNF